MKIKKACCAVAVAAAVAAGVSLWMRHDPDDGYCVRMRLNSARERTETIDGIRWHYGIVDGEALIVKAVRRGLGPFSDKLTLPAELGGCPVRAVCGSVFRQDDPVRSLTIPEGVVQLEHHSFANCANLESVTIPSTVKYIARHAFSACSRKLKVTANIRDAHISIGAFSAVNDLSEYRGVNRKGFERDGEGRLTFDGEALHGH